MHNLFAEMRAHVLAALSGAIPDLPEDVVAKVEVTPAREPAHGDMATNAALVAAKAARLPPPKIAAALVAALRVLPEVASAETAGPGFVNLRLRPAALRARAAGDPARGGGLWRLHARRGRSGECRVHLRQPDRTAACRPLPGRGGGRCARQSAGESRLRRHQGVLHQRCRRAGHRARLGRLLALPAGDRHRARRGGLRRRGARRTAVSRRLPDPGRREPGGAARRLARGTGRSHRRTRPLVRDRARRHRRRDDGSDARGPCAARRAPGGVQLRARAHRERRRRAR